jgi:hypothetical protein
VYHTEHDETDTARYRQMARSLNVLATGGSDYHGAGSGRGEGFGRIHLPADDFARLAGRAGWPVAS